MTGPTNGSDIPGTRPDALSRGKLRLLRRLRERKGRSREGLVLVEGPRAVTTALAAGARFRFVLLAAGEGVDAAGGGGEGERPLFGSAELRRSGVDVVRLPEEELAGLADTESPQGVLGVAEEPRPGLPEQAAGERILVLDAVQDPGNVGTLIRAAAAFLVDRVLALDGTADPWNAKAVRASAGLAFFLPIHRLAAAEALDWLEAQGIPLLVADADGRDVRALDVPRGPRAGFALLVGNEAAGPRDEARSRAAALVALPLPPGVESLNAALAGAVLLWELGPAGARTSLPPTAE